MPNKTYRPVVRMILDGYGFSPEEEGSAVLLTRDHWNANDRSKFAPEPVMNPHT